MARHSRFRSCFSFLWAVTLITLFNLSFSNAALAQPAPPTGNSAKLSTPEPAIFQVAPAISISGAPSSVAAGDLNGDGKLDLVVANSSAGKVTVLLGKGNGQFGAPVEYAVGKQPASVLLGDFNGDGKLDVVVCNEADGTLSVLLGNGDGTLQKPATYQVVLDPLYVAMGDLNGDGKPDLVVAGGASQTIAVLLNDGTGNFAKAVPYNLGRSPLSLAVADFDGDSHLDIASANTDGTVSILFGRGDGTVRKISSVAVGSAPLSSIVAGDFNNDGKSDLAVTQSGTKLLTVLLGTGNGTFQKGSSYQAGSNPAFVIATDLNGDGNADLMTANQSGNTFSVLLGNGDGTFQSALDFAVGNSPRAVAAGDFNGDGKADLAIVNFSDKSVSVPLGNGDGTFKAARSYNADLERKAVAVGDLDGDGKLDLVVTNYCGTDSSCAGNGTVNVFLANGDGSYRAAGGYPLGAGPLSVALADLNGDKKLDLIAVNRGDKTVSVLLGNGDGTFQSALSYPLAGSPLALAVGDFNKDGKIDLAITTDCGSSQCAQPGQLNILLGNGDSSFQPAATYTVGYSPASVAIGDVDGDGSPDVVVANACGQDGTCKSKGTASVLIGDAKGGFKSLADIALGNSPSSIALGDLAGRKILDLVVAHRGDNKVAVLQGNGDGSFKTPVSYPVGTAPASVIVADFNGDGKPDVAAANLKDSTISVLLGNGNGTLQPAAVYPAGAGPQSLAAVSPQGKGHADLVAANGNSGAKPMGSAISVLQGIQPAVGTHLPGSVTVANTTTPTPNPTSTYGDSVTFTATVVGNGQGVQNLPSGTVDFKDNGNAFDSACTGVALTPDPANPTTKALAKCTTTMLPAAPGGTPIVASYTGDSYYAALASASITQIINLAPLTVTAKSVHKPYGTALTFAGTEFTITSGTLFNGDTLTSVTLTSAGAAPMATAGSPYSIVPSAAVGTGLGNYTISYANGTLTVDPAPLTITANNDSKTYGQVKIYGAGSTAFTSSGLQNGETIGSVTLASTGAAASALVAGSPYPIVPSAATGGTFTASNYTITYANGMLAVHKATPTFGPLVLTVGANPSTYGQPLTIRATLTGASGTGVLQPTGTVSFKDTISNTPIAGCTAVTLAQGASNSTADCTPNPTLSVGGYSIQASYSDDGNYGPAAGSPMLPQTVIQVTPAFSGLPSPNITYGTSTVTVSGKIAAGTLFPPNGETVTVTISGNGITPVSNFGLTSGGNGSFSATLNTATIPVAAPYTVTYTYVGDSNFKSVTDASTKLIVNPALLTITANNDSKTYGQVKTYGAGSTAFTTSGLQNGETIGSVTLASAGGIATAATGSYPITPSAATGGTFTPSNYTITYANGMLTVNPALLTITANNDSKTYGQVKTYGAGSTAFTTTGLQNGETIGSVTLASTGAAATATVAGSPYPIVPSAATGGTITASNYTIAYANGALTVNPAALTITANAASKNYGTALTFAGTEFTTVGTLYNGDTVTSVTLTSAGAPAAATVAGSPYQIVPSNAVGTGLGNYTITYANGTLTVNKAAPAFSGLAASSSISYGTSSITVSGVISVSGTVYPPSGETVSVTVNGTTQSVLIGNSGSFSASFPTSTIPASTTAYTITYSYPGDSNFIAAPNDTSKSVTVKKATPLFSTLAASQAIVYGTASINLSGVVASGNVYPPTTDSVSITINGATVTRPIGSNGAFNAVFTTGTIPGSTTPYTITYNYGGDSNFNTANDQSTMLTINPYPSVPTLALVGGRNPAASTEALTFNANVKGVSNTAPTGNVTFSDVINGASTVVCTSALATISGTVNSLATCTSSVLPVGESTVVASYSGDRNYAARTSSGLSQTVQDFAVSSSPTSPVNVTQGYSNTTNPFTSLQVGMSATTGPANTLGFSDALGLTCAVVPLAGQSTTTVPTCVLTPSTTSTNVTCDVTTKICTIAGGTGTVAVTVSATSSTALGLYRVDVTATDQVLVPATLSHVTSLYANVVNNTVAVNVLPGAMGTTTATFTGPAGQAVTVPLSPSSCVLVTGSGLNVSIPAAGEPPSAIGISCSFSPSSVVLTGTSTAGGTGSVTVSVNTSTAAVAALRKSTGIFAAVWLGFPGIVLLGSLRHKQRSRKTVLQFFGMLLVLIALLQGIGCGGGFTRQPTVTGTPTGAYQVLVQATGNDGLTYSAIVPVNVGH